MHVRNRAVHPVIAKAARMLLVFLLVFWSSFSVETLVAFGDDNGSSSGSASSPAADPKPDPKPDPNSEPDPTPPQNDDSGDDAGNNGGGNSGDSGDPGNPSNPDTPDNPDNPGNPGNSGNSDDPVEREPDNPDNPGNSGSSDNPDDPDDEDKPKESDRYNINKHEDGTLTNLEIWELASADAGTVDKQLASAAATADGHGQSTKLSANRGELLMVAVPHWSGDTYNRDNPPSAGNADFVEWSVTGDTDCVDISENKGRLKLTGKSAGSVTIKVKLVNSASALVSGSFAEQHPNKAFEATLTVDVLAPYVNSMEILRPNGDPCSPDEALQLSEEELKSYAFQVKVRVLDQVTDETTEYTIGNGKNLKEVSGGLFEDVNWEVFDKAGAPAAASLATITQDGIFTMVGDLEKEESVQVRCTSEQGLNGTSVSPAVIIGKLPKEDVQGESHPQDTIHIVSNAVVKDGEKTPEGDAGAAESDSVAGASSSSASASAGAADADASAGTADAKTQPIDKTYTLAELTKLGFSSGTFTMNNAKGPVTVTGEGPTLTAVLADAGITEFSQILSVEFVDYRGVSTSFDWSALETAAPLLAARSYVHEDNADAPANSGNAADADEADGKLLDNTRFRLLYGAGMIADADALRYINEIRVNLATGEGNEDPTDSELEVYVDYVPVAKGDTAVLSAVLNQAIGSGSFTYRWQNSSDGKTWIDVPGNALQTLRVKTTDETIGMYYRVMLETNLLNDEGEGRATVSESVQIKEGNGFVVQLDYDPPIAGETAIFQAIVKDTASSVDLSKVEYVWEQSNDGGNNWSTIKNAKSSMLSIPTKPAQQGASGSENAGGDSSDSQATAKPVTLIYIRVRAIAPDGRVAVSNAQPLTAHVGGAGKDPDGGDDSGKVDPDNPQDATAPDLPDDESQHNTAQDPESEKDEPTESEQTPNQDNQNPPPKLTEVPNIVVENTPRQTPQHDGAAPETPTDQSTAQPEQAQVVQAAPSEAPSEMPSELIINPEITALIQDQKKTVDQALDTSRPGARWTQINAVETTPDQVRNILADNPFAPFVMPVGLGVIVAGGVEKLLAFRRQKRK